MLSRKLHLEQITRFHDKLEQLDKQIDAETDKDKKLNLYFQYHELTKFWNEIDNFIEFQLKQKLDKFDNA